VGTSSSLSLAGVPFGALVGINTVPEEAVNKRTPQLYKTLGLPSQKAPRGGLALAEGRFWETECFIHLPQISATRSLLARSRRHEVGDGGAASAYSGRALPPSSPFRRHQHRCQRSGPTPALTSRHPTPPQLQTRRLAECWGLRSIRGARRGVASRIRRRCRMVCLEPFIPNPDRP